MSVKVVRDNHRWDQQKRWQKLWNSINTVLNHFDAEVIRYDPAGSCNMSIRKKATGLTGFLGLFGSRLIPTFKVEGERGGLSEDPIHDVTLHLVAKTPQQRETAEAVAKAFKQEGFDCVVTLDYPEEG